MHPRPARSLYAAAVVGRLHHHLHVRGADADRLLDGRHRRNLVIGAAGQVRSGWLGQVRSSI